MKKTLIHILTAALALSAIAAVFVSCSGGGDVGGGLHAHDDVYVAGTFGLLKNGVSQSGYGSARSVFVTGSGDVFVAGNRNGQAMLWKNGVSQTLYYGSYGTPSASYALSVCASNGNVIVVGYAYYGGRYYGIIWDGNTGDLIGSRWYSSTGDVYLNSVYCRDNDHYAVGYTINNNGYHIPLLIKNNSQQTLNTNSDGYVAKSVYVSKTNNVYVAGYIDGGKGVIWKDGVIQTESLGSVDTYLFSIFVSDNGEVYVAGDDYYNNRWTATIWRDYSVLYHLPIDSGATGSWPMSVFVSGKDVYAAGYETYETGSSGTATAVLWKNGARQVLGSGIAYSVFVK
jgi:hypothetical protein